MRRTLPLFLAALLALVYTGCTDAVTGPEAAGLAAEAAEEAAAAKASGTIVDVALTVNSQTGEFSTLIAALVAADLVDALDGRKPYTVFAPTDAAFAKLGLNAGNIGTALPVETLTDILLYHLTQGKRYSQSIVSARQLRMVNGDFAEVNPGLAINDAAILDVDIKASNGVLHVIDTVLLPPAD